VNRADALTCRSGLGRTHPQRPRMFRQETSVEGQELGDIHHRVAGEASRARRQQDIPWSVGEFHVAGDRGYDRGLNPAEIEGICLDHKYWSPVSRLGAARLGKICPPSLPALNFAHFYQVSLSRDFSWARCNPESTFAGCRAYTSFKRSVIALLCCRVRNSAIALAYNWLLETRRRRAAASAKRKRSSGIETAVFMPTV
jgi:hypothetical protein